MNKKQLGAEGERFVCNQLQHKKFKIVEMNWRTRFGEIDIIAEKDQILYIIEVRTRTIHQNQHPQFGYAIEAITRSKIRKLYQLAQLYVVEKKMTYSNYRIMFAPVSYLFEERRFVLESFITV